MSQLSYIEKLLDGVEVEWKALGEIYKFQYGKGNTIPKTGGEYPVYGSNGIVGSHHEYNSEDAPVIGHIGAYAGIVNWGKGKHFVTYNGVICRMKSEEVLPQYAYYILLLQNFGEKSNSASQPFVSYHILETPVVPIPPLNVQIEIVRILDAFTELSAELSAELYMRKKQYSHYQFEMFQFTETTQYLKIGECCDIKKGLTPIKKATPGKYPLVATTEERQSSSEYHFDCAAVCVPLISSRGHGVASIDRIYFQEGKFALGNILCAIIPNDSTLLSAKFLRYYLFDKKDVLLVPLMRGGANVSLTMDSLKKVKIPIPPIADQQRIVRILDKFDELVKGLPREIELSQQQYEYYRELLLSFPKTEVADHD